MIHAKTAVADGMWSRIGSTNMNLASLLGNWEIDVAVTDRTFAAEMEALFEADLEASVEIALRTSPVPGAEFKKERRATERLVVTDAEDQRRPEIVTAREARAHSYRGTELGRIVGRMARAGTVLARALVGERLIGREDIGWVTALAVLMLVMAGVGIVAPRVLAWPLSVVLFWLAMAAIVRLASRRRPAG
jgi:cardiolipin synthase